METLDLTIEGMTCGSCVSHVRKALAEVPGIEVTNVSIGSAQVRVTDEGNASVVTSVIDAIDDAGYRADVARTA
jgi:Cu+-exporting ATPase